jgi:hypothetical protein
MTCLGSKEQEEKYDNYMARVGRAKKYKIGEYDLSLLNLGSGQWSIKKPMENSHIVLIHTLEDGEYEYYQLPLEFLKLLDIYRKQVKAIRPRIGS